MTGLGTYARFLPATRRTTATAFFFVVLLVLVVLLFVFSFRILRILRYGVIAASQQRRTTRLLSQAKFH